MKNLSILALSLTSLVGTAAADNSLEASSGFDRHVEAPRNALELGVATGYTQGVGPVGEGMADLDDLSKAGGVAEVSVLYRINPTWAIGAYGSFSGYQRGDLVNAQTDVLGATAGIQGVVHLRPRRSVDPWVSLGTGWRGLWLSPEAGKNTALQGLELARLQIGVDYRISDDIAISPVIGGSLNMFVSQSSAMTGEYAEITDKQVNFIGFAGLAGRFDLGGKR
jgi:hypothetical protein